MSFDPIKARNWNIKTEVKGLKCKYPGSLKVYTFRTPNQFDQLNFKVGDYIIANSKNGLAIVIVTSILGVATIDKDNFSNVDYPLAWAFQKVSTQTLEALIKWEKSHK